MEKKRTKSKKVGIKEKKKKETKVKGLWNIFNKIIEEKFSNLIMGQEA